MTNFLLRNCSTGQRRRQESQLTSHRSHMYHMGEAEVETSNNANSRADIALWDGGDRID